MPIKPEAVLDTNVLYAAVRSKRGASNYLLRQALGGGLIPHITVPLVLEYEDVLLRKRCELGITERDVVKLLGALVEISRWHEVHYLWRSHVRDPEDAHVLEAALAASCPNLVTFNTRDFQDVGTLGVDVQTPERYLQDNF